MIKWLALTKEQRLTTLRAASAESGISTKALEKDWWVSLVLKAIFQSPYAPYLLFKGGTSLSKCWKLIQRFSEDIDLAVDRDFICPDVRTWTRTQIKKLKKEACIFTSTTFKQAIEKELYDLGVPKEMITIVPGPVDPTNTDKDPQELILHYEMVTDKLEYVEDAVKIEVSARSLKDPWQECLIESLLDEYLPSTSYSEKPFVVAAVEPKRTFLEKIFLLHEEFQKEPGKIRHFRMSRHLSDLFHIKDTEHGKSATADEELFNTIAAHRQQFSYLSWVNYELHRRGSISFLPPTDVLMKAYREDYTSMRTTMIYGDAPSFDELITALSELKTLLNNQTVTKATHVQALPEESLPFGEELIHLIERAKNSVLHPNSEIEGSIIKVYLAPSAAMPGATNKQAYYIHFIRENGELVYKNIERAV